MNHAETGANQKKSYDGGYMKIGKEGERIVMQWLEDNPKVIGVTDFRDVREIQEADVDVGIKLYTGQICLAEIKTDTYLGKSGNIIAEVLRINHRGNPRYAGYLGWSFRSPAEHLLFYAPNRTPKAIYKIPFAEYRSVIQSYSKQNNLKFIAVRTDSGKTTYNILIPEDQFDGMFQIYDL